MLKPISAKDKYMYLLALEGCFGQGTMEAVIASTLSYISSLFKEIQKGSERGTKSTKNVYHSKALEHIYASLDNLQFPFFLVSFPSFIIPSSSLFYANKNFSTFLPPSFNL